MANPLVEISKHSTTLLRVVIDKGTIYFYDKLNTVVYAESESITITDGTRTNVFEYTKVRTPTGNGVLEIVDGIKAVIES